MIIIIHPKKMILLLRKIKKEYDNYYMRAQDVKVKLLNLFIYQ